MPFGQNSIRLGAEEAHIQIPLRKLALENRQHLTLLIKYVKLGNSEQVKELLHTIRTRPNRSLVINGRDRHSHTALHYAAKLNRADIVALLVGAHADVNKRSDDNDKVAPLHYVCRWQAPQISEGSVVNLEGTSVAPTIHLLLQHGAEINCEDSYGMTGLHHACQRGNLDTVMELLKVSDIKVDAVDKQAQTPLHMAANKGDTKIVALLLEAGANVFAEDELGSRPIHLSAREGHVETAKAMVRHITQNQPSSLDALVGAQDGEGGTILHEAVNNGNLEMVKFAFSVGRLDPNSATLNGDTALHIAAGKGHREIVELLVEAAKAEIDPVDEAGNSPLHDAARLNREKIIVFLLAKGADVDLANSDGRTPLMRAASWGQSRAVGTLLHAGANVTLRDNEDKTVFWHAVKGNHVGAVQVLSQNVKYSSFLELPDQFGHTALHIAASQGAVELCELVIGHGAVLDARNDEERTPLHLACMKGHPETARVLCEKSEDLLEDEDESGNKPLHLAAIRGHGNAVRMLLDLGAAVDGRNSKGWTPLDCAAAAGSLTCCEVLLEHDAPVDAKDKRNRTPLHIAAREGHTKIVLLLLDSGADISHCDKTGRNCLDLAIDHQEEEVAEAIVQHERWRDAMRNVSRSKLRRKGNRYQNTPLLKLIRRMPDVAQIVFTQCMAESPNIQPESIDYKVTMDYEFIDYIQPAETARDDDGVVADEDEVAEVNDFGDEVETWKDWNPDRNHNHPLLVMVDSNRESLLAHPLVSTLLDYKWNKVIRYSYYITLALYTVFLAFITSLALVAEPELTALAGNRTLPICSTDKENALYFVRIVIILYCLCSFIAEGVELVLNGSSYFTLENLGDWSTFVTAFIFAWEFEQSRQCVVTNWQWQVGVVAVWLAWLTFIFNQRRSGILGIYVVMFAHVFTTFIKLLAVIVLFVIAFGLAFYMLFNGFAPVISYRTPGRALLKTAVSMTGEFEFDTTFNNEQPLPFPGVSYFLFTCFLVIMPIILMNMLVGLAVDDIKGVQDNARLSQLSMQVRLILSIEAKLPRYFHDNVFGLNISTYTVSPNEPATTRARIRDYLFEDRLTTEKIQETINPHKSELDRLEDQNRELRDQLKDLITSVSENHGQVQDMRRSLKAICRHHNISPGAHDV